MLRSARNSSEKRSAKLVVEAGSTKPEADSKLTGKLFFDLSNLFFVGHVLIAEGATEERLAGPQLRRSLPRTPIPFIVLVRHADLLDTGLELDALAPHLLEVALSNLRTRKYSVSVR